MKSQRLIRLLSESQTDQRTRNLDLEIANLREDYQQVQAEIRERSPGYAALVQPRPLSLKDVQQLLDADTVLLEYSLGEERSHVWGITSNSFVVQELPKRAVVEHEARKLYLTLASRSSGFADPKTRLANWAKTDALSRRLAADLSRKLLGPVADLVKGHPRLVIVSDGVLQYVPFAALSSPDTGSFPLMAKHEIVSLPSASIIAELRRARESRPVPPREVAVLADPVFDSDDVRIGLASIEHQSGISRVRRSSLRWSESLQRSASDVGLLRNGKFHFNRLVYTRDEAAAIAAAAGRRQVMQALDFRANRATAMSPELANYRIVHFATHGLVNSKNPALSGLVFSLVDPRGKSVEGFFGLEDVYNTKLPVDMVVLSGCQTALGENVSGEGLIGLTRGFMYAGATRVVASLWSVSDEATADLMAEFYKAMERDGMRPAAALRVAQTKMLKHERWRSPYYWAAFQIQGEWQ